MVNDLKFFWQSVLTRMILLPMFSHLMPQPGLRKQRQNLNESNMLLKKLIVTISLVFAFAVIFPGGAHAEVVHLGQGSSVATPAENEIPSVQSDFTYPGSWSASATTTPEAPRMIYVFMNQAGTTLWGIFYRCKTANVLPCTWTNTWQIYIPDGVIAVGTAYSITSITPFSHYTGTVTFTSSTTASETITACTAVTEPGYVTPPSTGNYATETAPCSSTLPSTSLWQKLL